MNPWKNWNRFSRCKAKRASPRPSAFGATTVTPQNGAHLILHTRSTSDASAAFQPYAELPSVPLAQAPGNSVAASLIDQMSQLTREQLANLEEAARMVGDAALTLQHQAVDRLQHTVHESVAAARQYTAHVPQDVTAHMDALAGAVDVQVARLTGRPG